MSKNSSSRETARKALWLILAAVILAAVVNLVHPKRIPWIGDWAHRIEAQAVAENMPLVQLSDMLNILRDGSHRFVDARPADEYAQAHLPGAVSLPFETFDEKSFIALPLDKPLVIYCTGPECDDSLLLALEFRKLGLEDVSVFIGGMELWQAELLHTEGEVAQ